MRILDVMVPESQKITLEKAKTLGQLAVILKEIIVETVNEDRLAVLESNVIDLTSRKLG